MNLSYLKQKLVWQMTGEELLELIVNRQQKVDTI